MRAITERQQSLIELINSHKNQSTPAEDPVQKLERLKETCLTCNNCVLRSTCTQVVFGDGNPQTKLMLIGEGPGADEDRIGIPFVGRAGQLLDRILAAADIKREEVYIANIVKCRPPSNRLPLQSEVEACLPYLKEQIELINPEIIVCLGALATKTLIGQNLSITRCRGTWHERDSRRIIATFHPAALLRDPGKKKYVWEDIKEVIKYYKK